MSEFKSLIGIVRILNCFFLFFPNGVIIVNALRKSLVLATSFAALGVYNSAMEWYISLLNNLWKHQILT